MLGWFKKDRNAETAKAGKAAPAPAGAAAPAAPEEPEAFTWAWNTLEAAEEGVLVQDRHPFTESQATLVGLLEPLLREYFEANPPAPAAFPAVAVQVLQLLEKHDPEVPELLKVIGQDPAISMHVLQMANSAYYHRGRDVQDLQGAVLKMGVSATGDVVVAVAGRSLFDPNLKAELELFKTRMRDLYRNSMAIAFAAREFSEQSQRGNPHHLFLAGMFHDIGHTLSLRALSSLMLAGKVPKDLPPLAMDALLERTHLEMGSSAHTVWNLPGYLGIICSKHHHPSLPTTAEYENLHVLRVVSGLNRLVVDPNDPSHACETRDSLQALGLDRGRALELFERMAFHRELVKAMVPA